MRAPIAGIGVDPGLDGAIALYDGRVLAVHDMPTVSITRNGKGKREVSAPLLAAVLREFVHERLLVADTGYDPNSDDVFDVRVLVERVGAMKGQGVSSMFSFGRSAGIIEGVLAGLRLPCQLVVPQVWQKAMGVRGGKDGARARAAQLFPNHAAMFARKKDDGRADAALLAWMAYNRGVN